MIDGTETLSSEDFEVISRYVERETGIRLPEHKRGMVQVRVAKRVRALGLEHYSDYVRYVFSDRSGHAERVRLVDAITTNKTDFFREDQHFKYLAETAFPALLAREPGLGKERPLVAWCAACSTGQEPYSLAMLLKSLEAIHGRIDFTVHATDICCDALAAAERAVYSEELVRPVPEHMKRAYLLRSRDRSRRQVRIAPEVRSHVVFDRANLLSDPQPVLGEADIVFCRNVLIYFNRETQGKVLRRILRAMRPGGYLFVGHSEGLLGFDLPIDRVATSVYRLKS